MNFTMLLREHRYYWDRPIPSYGVGFDDVVVEWREIHPVSDRTPCSDPSTWAVDYATQDPMGGSTTCIDGPLAGFPCTSDTDCGAGTCSSRRASGCAQITRGFHQPAISAGISAKEEVKSSFDKSIDLNGTG